MSKVPRNHPCPCGSGKKFKHCHGVLAFHGIESSGINPGSPPPEVILKIAQKIEESRIKSEWRKIRMGETQLPNSIEFAGKRMVGVGGTMYAVNPAYAPINFMSELLVKTLGEEWFAEQLAAAETTASPAHPIISWYQATIGWQTQKAQGDGTSMGILSGPARAWFLLGYDIWVLSHHFLLQPLLPRLRDIKQFQGARYELTTYALFVRGGFKLERDAETDNASKHVEFIAHNSATGERVAVEAKSRHRPGVLGFPSDGYTLVDDPEPGIADRLRRAIEQRRPMPYVICIEMNLPPASNRQRAEIKLSMARAEVETVAREYSSNGEPFPATLVVLTNYSHHYGDPRKLETPWYQSAVGFRNPAHKFLSSETVNQIVKALGSYGYLPESWDEFDH